MRNYFIGGVVGIACVIAYVFAWHFVDDWNHEVDQRATETKATNDKMLWSLPPKWQDVVFSLQHGGSLEDTLTAQQFDLKWYPLSREQAHWIAGTYCSGYEGKAYSELLPYIK